MSGASNANVVPLCLGTDQFSMLTNAIALAGDLTASVEPQGWQPIETAPRDGTRIDVWFAGEYPQRWADVYWGKPDHCCGEMGQYCDSDWHGAEPGWVDSLEMPISRSDVRRITHWMPIPGGPDSAQRAGRVAVESGVAA